MLLLAEPGDRVEADEAIAQIETDKVSKQLLALISLVIFPGSDVAFLILLFDSSIFFR